MNILLLNSGQWELFRFTCNTGYNLPFKLNANDRLFTLSTTNDFLANNVNVWSIFWGKGSANLMAYQWRLIETTSQTRQTYTLSTIMRHSKPNMCTHLGFHSAKFQATLEYYYVH